MAKPKDEGFPYCQQDTDIYFDPKIRMLLSRFGCDGYCVWDYIKQAAYRENGYYVEWNDERLELAAADLGISAEKTGLIVAYLLKRSLLVSKSFNGITVLTSHGIQNRFQNMAKSAKREYYEFRPEIWILSETETVGSIFCTLNQNNSGIKGDNSGIKGDNSGIKPQKNSKEKESKENIYHQPPYIPLQGGEGEEPNGQAVFFAKFPNVLIDNYSTELQEITDEDWKEITKQFEQSDWLRENCKTLSMLCRISKRIIAGEFSPFRKWKAEESREAREEAERRRRAEEFDRRFGADSQ